MDCAPGLILSDQANSLPYSEELTISEVMGQPPRVLLKQWRIDAGLHSDMKEESLERRLKQPP